jgi:uncharacterized repeat protein (TIGR03847 family)
MSNTEVDLNPVDFITVGTMGPKGKRVFYLQAGQGPKIVSLIMEKAQAQALSQAVAEMLDELAARIGPTEEVDLSGFDMDLREPIVPDFRIAQMGLGYDESQDMIALVAQELVISAEDQDPRSVQPKVIRFWGSRQQMRALSQHAAEVAQQGRPDPRQDGRLVYYWIR